MRETIISSITPVEVLKNIFFVASFFNDVCPCGQVMLPSANEVMLRINDVALRANRYAFGVIWSESPPQFPAKPCNPHDFMI